MTLLRRLLNLIGAVVVAIGAAMFSAVVTALIYQEWVDAVQIAGAGAITMGIGWFAWHRFERPEDLSRKEGFAVVGLAWFAIAVFGTLPYLLTGSITNITDAFFETAAGFTTTGASVIPDPGDLSHGILLWRALTQWIGGMGIIVLSIAVLPLLGSGGVELARAESPGPTPDRLTPRFRETAKRLWLVYLGFSVLEVIFLVLGDMTLFESIAHSLTTMSTGGYGTDVQSLGGFSSYSQWIVIVFMTIAGASFALHYRALRDPKEYGRSPELKLYIGILLAASTFIIVGNYGDGAVADTIRDAVFTSVSLVTTTGFATADFGLWVPALQVLVLGLMFVGGMSGSTGGSVKPYRLAVLSGAARADLRRVIHPRGVFVTRFGKDTIPRDVVESVQSFFLLYMFIFMTATLLFAVIAQSAGAGFDLVTSASAVASSLGNVGPGLGDLGPSSNYLAVPGVAKWLLSLLMLIGRLEIFPILLLFTRELWRR
ncbi:MAG: TrkH family potassium uptake protein [bacterium]|nr:TrkH family potassium uptake protein [bacterium]